MENIDIHKYELSDFKFTPLGASAAMETYKVVVDFTADGQNMNVAAALLALQGCGGSSSAAPAPATQVTGTPVAAIQ